MPHINGPIGTHGLPAGLVGHFCLQPSLDHGITARYAEARGNSHECPSGGVDDQHMRQQADGAGGGKGGKSPRMSYGAQQARGPPAADEKTDEMC